MFSLRCVVLLVLPMIVFDAASFAEYVKVPVNGDIPGADPPINYRLSSDVIPILYTIKLEPNIVPGDFTFAGESQIDIEVKNRTSEIVLHSKDLTIQENVTRLLINDEPVENVNFTFTYETETDFLDSTGDSYANDRGEEIWFAATHFSPTWARRAFPCFDEPALKAKFKIFIKHSGTYRAISNMPAISLTRSGYDTSLGWTEFDVTPVMSTYLVAFIVSDFSYLSTDDGKFKVYSRKNAIESGKFALSFGPKALKHLEDYTGMKHVLPKMDNVAIPQMPPGGMENWGIVTYSEDTLLRNENVSSTFSKQAIAQMMTHEFAHQWFGNLVTPSWWNYTWLVEGIADYLQYFITDKIEPTWRLMDLFVTEHLQERAFASNEQLTALPMNIEYNSPEEIKKIVSVGLYTKASSIIQMFSHAVSEDVFKNGLQKHLKNYQYTTTTSDDFFESLQKAAPTNIEVDLVKASLSWANQPGYPVVTVIRNHTSGDAIISQKRFLKEPSNKSEELWYIPINYAAEDKLDFVNTAPMLWMSNKSYPITGLTPGKWIIFNKQQTGFYRVNYDSENWRLLADYLKNPNNVNTIPVLNRAQLLDDSFNLAEAGELPSYMAFLELSEYLQHEDDCVPWHTAHRAFYALNKALMNTEKYDLFKLYVRRLINKLENTIGYEEAAEDDYVIKISRQSLIDLACKMGSAQCLTTTHEKLLQHIDGSNKLSPDLLNAVLCSGLLLANATIWEATYNLTAKMEPGSSEYDSVVDALGCSSDPIVLTKLFEDTSLKEAKFNRDKVLEAIRFGSPAAIDVGFFFFTKNYQAIVDRDGNIAFISKCLNTIANQMTTVTQLQQLERFIESLAKSNEALAAALKLKGLLKAKKKVEWVKKYGPAIFSFLDTRKLIDDELNSSSKGVPLC